MIVNGRALASELLSTLAQTLPRTAVVRAIVVAPSPATESYLAIKDIRAAEAGMHLDIVRMQENASTEDVIEAVLKPGCDALIVQLPLPAHLDSRAILNAIPERKDADVLSETAYTKFTQGVEGALVPPVVAAVAEILRRSGIEVPGKRAVVVGQGRLVGEPCAVWLRSQGASVSVLTRESGDFSLLADADIIVSGAGAPGIITPEHIREGVVLIDAGTSEQGGALVGDADPACAGVASVFTPVPGGVGPIAVACLFRNVGLLLERGLQAD